MRHCALPVLAFAAACATQPATPTPSPSRPVAQVDPAKEAAARAEATLRAEAEARARKEAELLDLFESANLIAMAPAARARLRALNMSEIAQLRFDGGDLPGAVEAIERAVKECEDAGDPKLKSVITGSRFLIVRYAALEAAKESQYDKSIRLLDKLALAPGLTTQQKEQVGGDRYLILEMKGGPKDQNGTTLRNALSRMLGPDAAGGTRGEAVPEQFTMNDLRAVIGRELDHDVSEAKLPSAGGMPQAETGAFDQGTVLRVVSANKKSVSICYEQSLKRGESLKGKLELLLTVAPTGGVSEASVKSTAFRGTELARCISETVLRWRFPPFGGDARQVEIPFVLNRTL